MKYLLMAYLVLVLAFEILWTTFIVYRFHADLATYDWDATWIKEFYKSTKNFFLFTAIIVSLVLFLGLAAAGSENKSLLMVFLVLFMGEWGFELIGVYCSQDWNVMVYKLIPGAMRPGLILVGFLFYLKLRGQPDPQA